MNEVKDFLFLKSESAQWPWVLNLKTGGLGFLAVMPHGVFRRNDQDVKQAGFIFR
jgi:hypothetical protein